MKLLITVASGEQPVTTPTLMSLTTQGWLVVGSSVEQGLQKIYLSQNSQPSKLDEVIVEFPPVTTGATFNPLSGLIQALASWDLNLSPFSWGVTDRPSLVWLEMASNLIFHAEQTGIDLQVFTAQVMADGQMRVSFKDV